MTKVFKPDKDATKIVVLPTICYCCLSFLDLFCLNLVLPNIPFMCASFFPDISETEIGYYSGYLSAAYPFGGMFGNILMGYIADKYGRKPCFLISSFGTFFLINLFGLSINYPMALIVRFLWGFCNSSVGVVKTYVSEVCSRKTQSLGFSLLSVSSGMSRILGPLVGGLLANPQYSFPDLVKAIPLLQTFPYYFPCFIAGLVCLFTFFFTLFFLPETLSKENIHKSAELKKKYAEESKRILKKKHDNHDYILTPKEEALVQLSQDSYFDLIKNKYVLITCVLYGMVGFIQGIHDSILPLWLLNPHSKGGFEWTQTDMGYLYAGVGPIQILFTPLIYPQLSKIYSYKNIYIWSTIVYGIELIIYPAVSYTNTMNEWLQWYMIIFSFALSLCTRLVSFTSSMVLISNSTYQDFRGKVNGMGQLAVSFFRTVGPSISTSIFAWSTTNDNPFPFNYAFSFILIGIIMIIFSVVGYTLPDWINETKWSLRDVIDDFEKESNMNEIKEEKDTIIVNISTPATDVQTISTDIHTHKSESQSETSISTQEDMNSNEKHEQKQPINIELTTIKKKFEN